MNDLHLATRWLAGISTGACLFLLVATGALLNAISSQRESCENRRAELVETQQLLLSTLETSNKAVEASSRVIDRVARIDYFMQQGQAMEQFRTLLTADLELDKPVAMAIGGCE